jgi:hypothetical protein
MPLLEQGDQVLRPGCIVGAVVVGEHLDVGGEGAGDGVALALRSNF